MSYFWSSTGPGYIEPKRTYQLIGIVDFIQPFLIQRMDKPNVQINTTNVTKILKNGTLRKENHYKSDYSFNSITVTAIDSHDEVLNANLNNSHKLYRILTDGGYTQRANDIGPARTQLRFPSFRILEILPQPKESLKTVANSVASAVGNAAASIIGGGDFSSILGGTLDAVDTAFEFLDPSVSGVYTFLDPVITNVSFGEGINYTSDGIVTISLTINYSSFRYEKSIT